MIGRSDPQILVTGFGAFPGMPENPTERLVGALAAAPPPGVTAERLETRWDLVEWFADRARRFDAVVMFGVAGGATMIRYERVATPFACARPDAVEALPPALPRYRYSMFDVPELVREARMAGFPVRLSHSAGTYVCNAGYGAALAGNPQSLFVHVPQAARRGALGHGGLERHARWLIRELRDTLRPDTRKALAYSV